MFDLFGFDPTKFTDEELLERVVELNRRMTWASRMGSYAIVQQLQSQKIVIEMEQRERMFRQGIGSRMMSTPAVVVETDPDLAAQHREEQEREIAKAHPAPRSRPKPLPVQKERLRPTSSPTPDKDE